MFGAILGDIIGSRFEWRNHKSKDFELFTDDCECTDDSIMTMAIAKAVCDCKGDYSKLEKNAIDAMRLFGNQEIGAGYGEKFYHWLLSENPEPYYSFGNGAGMRISPVGFVAKSIDECKNLSRIVTAVTHNHPDGIKGAEAVAVCIFLAKNGHSKEQIKEYVEKNYYKLDFTLDQIRPTYGNDLSCENSIPQAIQSFLESNSFEDTIRNAVSIGGDSDTIAAIAGSIAEAFYGIDESLIEEMRTFCRHDFLAYVEVLEVLYNGYDINLTLDETKEILKQ